MSRSPKVGDREEGGAFDGLCQGAGELGIRDRVGRHGVHGKPEELAEVAEVDPAHPLAAVADPCSDAEAERR